MKNRNIVIAAVVAVLIIVVGIGFVMSSSKSSEQASREAEEKAFVEQLKKEEDAMKKAIGTWKPNSPAKDWSKPD